MSACVQVGCSGIGYFFGILTLLIVNVLTKEVIDVRIQGASLDYANPNYLTEGLTTVRLLRKSRASKPAFNAFFPFIKDVPLETNVSYHMFQKVGNAWKGTVVKGLVPLCVMIESKNKLARALIDSSNFPKKCPVKKGNYSVTDMVVTGDDLPPLLPAGEMKAKISWGIPQTAIVTYSGEVKLDKRGKPEASFGSGTLFAANKHILTETLSKN